RYECNNSLTFQIIGPPDNCGFGYCWMTNKRAFNLHCPNPMTGDVDDVVNSAHDPQITVFITASTVAGEIHAGDLTPVLFLVPLGITVDRSQHRRPRLLDH